MIGAIPMATVLVLEDDALSQKIIAKTLTNAGHEPLTTATIEQAWIQLRHYVIVDLVILDNQLNNEWGWEFLRELRNDPIYKGVPVVVYTAHTERSSLLKYVQLGVQGMLVKPYVTQAVLAEVAKALKTSWASHLLESPQSACERLNINEADYSYIVQSAVSTLARSVREAQQLQGTMGARLHPIIEHLKSECGQLGSPLFKTLLKSADDALAQRDPVTLMRTLSSMETVLGLIRKRAATFAAQSAEIRTPVTAAQKADEPPPALLFEPPTGVEATFHRKIAAQPIWSFGRHFGRLRGAKLVTPADLEKMGENLLASDPLYSFFTAIKLTARVPELTVDETARAIGELPGFEPVYLRIATQLGFKSDTPTLDVNIRHSIQHLGTAKAVSLLVAGRIAAAGKAPSPLDLRPLLEHTVAVSLLSFEIGRLLKLADPYQLAAAGAMHDIGKWLFAVGEPALYAAALAITQAEQLTIANAETEIFGLAHPEAGRLLLQIARESPLLCETTLYHQSPEKVADPQLAPGVCAVHIAHHFARALQSGDEKYATAVKTSFSAQGHPIWTVLKNNGVEPPADMPKLVEAILILAQTTASTTAALIKGA